MSNEDNLTGQERAELDGLRAASAKGRLTPESAGWGRMLELIGISEGKGRTEVVEEWDWQRVKDFYGVGRAFVFEMEALGRERGRRVPWEDAVRLGEWFSAMKSVGARKRGAPAAVLEKIKAAVMRVEAAPVVGVVRVERAAVKVEEDEMVLDFEGAGEAGAAEVLEHIRRQVFVLQAEVERRQAEGKRSGDLKLELESLWAQQRQWELSVEKIRKGDEAQEAQQRKMMSAWAAEAWGVMRRCVLEASDDKVRAAVGLNAAAERLHEILKPHFGI